MFDVRRSKVESLTCANDCICTDAVTEDVLMNELGVEVNGVGLI